MQIQYNKFKINIDITFRLDFYYSLKDLWNGFTYGFIFKTCNRRL